MKALKTLLIALASISLLLVIAAVAVPLVVDIDQHRPRIVQLANERINGKVELGKLALSLWGKLRIDISGLQLADASGRKIVAVNEAYLNVPFSTLIKGAPEVTLKLDRPELNVVKDPSGKLNVMMLMKEQNPESPAATPSQPSAGSSAPVQDREILLPGIVKQAKLSVEVTGANLVYHDRSTSTDSQLETRVSDLNLRLRDISLSRPTEIELWADLNTRMGKLLPLQGPAKLQGRFTVVMQGPKVDRFQLSSRLDLDGVDVAVPPFFRKEKGIDANVELELGFGEKALSISKLDAKFFNAQIQAKGMISNVGIPGASPQIRFEARSNEIELKPWSKLVPMLKEFELGGSAKLEASVDGPAERLAYQALVSVSALTAKAPRLKTQPRFDAKVKIATDRIDELALTMKAPGNDLSVKGKLISFTAPKLTLEATSSGMDLDQLIEFPPKVQTAQAAAPAPAVSPAASTPGEASTQPASDYDALMDPLRKSKIMQNFTATATLDLKSVKFYGVKMTDAVAQLSFKDLVAFVNSMSLRVFGGIVQANASADLKPAKPTYIYAAQASSLDLSEAVASQFQLFKNTLLGKAQVQIKGEGESFNPAIAMEKLDAKGKLKVEQATFATIDIGKLATEGLNQAIDRAAEKVPPLKGKRVNGLPGGASIYEFIASDFTISGGKFNAPNFVAKAAPNRGIDLKGSTQVGLKDYSLKSSWEISDSYNLTKARDLSVEAGGVRVEHVLAEGNGPIKFPVNVNCTVMAPCYSYGEVPQYLAKVALANLSRAAQGKAKEELRKQAESVIQKNAPQVEEKLKDIGKKIFGR